MALWRLLLPLSALIALAHCGGKTLSPQESSQFLQLFRRYCSSPASGPTQEGNTFFYCKTSDNGPITLNVNHDSEVSSGDTPKQVIFVQPPSYNYQHSVALRGSPGSPQQTDIYVLPSNAEHSLQLNDQRSAVQAQKPSLYFLSDNQQQSGGQQGGQQGGRPPTPIVGSTGFSSSSAGGQRPSAPPPNPSNPNVIGIGTEISGGYQQQAPVAQQQYSQAYGAPAFRTQRNSRGSHYSKYSTF